MNKVNHFDLSGKKALITGASGLLGKQHCIALSELNAKVFVTDLDLEKCQDTCKELQQATGKDIFFPFKLDVTNEKSISQCQDLITKDHGTLDILVNNAAIDPKFEGHSSKLEMSRLENFDLNSWNFQINVGLTGAFLCSKHFGTEMAKNSGGVILNIASDLSVIAPDQRIYKIKNKNDDEQPVKPITYSVIKHGLVGLTKYLATYWAEKNIRVNSLSPGGVFNNHTEEFLSKLTPLIPMGRMAELNEYHGCIQFLCSQASSYMTGQNLTSDGGRSVW